MKEMKRERENRREESRERERAYLGCLVASSTRVSSTKNVCVNGV